MYLRILEILLQALQSSGGHSTVQRRKLRLREFDPRSCDQQTVEREPDGNSSEASCACFTRHFRLCLTQGLPIVYLLHSFNVLNIH